MMQSKKLLSILRDETRLSCRDARHFKGCESGMVTWASLIGICFLMVLAGLVYNTGNTINRKLETQNAADAASYSGSLWVARGMNAVTASNHLIGELTALYVIHHSLGGEFLDEELGDENDQQEVENWNEMVEMGYDMNENSTIPAAEPGPVTNVPKSDVNSTIYEAMMRLKRVMFGAYMGHVIAYGTYQVGQSLLSNPYTAALGAAMVAIGLAGMAAALVVELKVIQEYLVLTVVEVVAIGGAPVKRMIPTFIDGLYLYQKATYIATPLLAKNAAEEVARKHGAEGVMRGDIPSAIPSSIDSLLSQGLKIYPTLPVEPEDTTNEQRSQLMRATYPWVAYWRADIRRFFRNWCTLSKATDYYLNWTNRYSLQACEWLRHERQNYNAQLTVVNHGRSGSGDGKNGHDIKLFVMVGLNEQNVDKSQEKWNDWNNKTQATGKAEALFVHMGFAKLESPKVSAPAFFRQENPDGVVALSQSMVYSANKQQRPAGTPGNGQRQAEVGWDTLNWVANAIEYKTNRDLSSPPRIRLNWHAKLTPVTLSKLTRVYPTLANTGKVEQTLRHTRESLFLTNH